MVVGVTATSFAGACGGGSNGSNQQTKLGELGAGCVFDSDCKEPYACAFQRCHAECVTTGDCPEGQRCVLTDEDFHVCQLEAETSCTEHSDCLGEQHCGSDAECRDVCDAADDCVADQVCASDGSCAEPDEVDEDGNLPDGLGTGGSGGSGGTSTTGGGNGGTAATGGESGAGGAGGAGSGEPPECGNAVRESGEGCDDGGAQLGDGCNADCEVEAGWHCDRGEPCEDIDECKRRTAECHASATCHNEEASYECECYPAFVGDGFDCEDPCKADPASCSLRVVQVVAGSDHTCALLESGQVRCWGDGERFGVTGYGNTDVIGDNELPTQDVAVGGTVVQLAAGGYHTCALLDNGKVRCWGQAEYGALGYGNINDIGDDELPEVAGDVNVGGPVKLIAAGGAQTCALLDSGAVRCWGHGVSGALGYGNVENIGDNETPADAGNVKLGGVATQIAVGGSHTCAVMTGGGLKCWGRATRGQLGYANDDDIGDNETPAAVGEVDVGGDVAQVTAGSTQTCALLTTGAIRCWGGGGYGALGYGNTDDIGDDETPASAGNVPIGATVSAVSSGSGITCAVLEGGDLLCWGADLEGQLGRGDLDPYPDNDDDLLLSRFGDDETPDTLHPIVVGDTVESVAIGGWHTCVVTTSAAVRCWGDNRTGAVGIGQASEPIGDDENPSYWGPVKLL